MNVYGVTVGAQGERETEYLIKASDCKSARTYFGDAASRISNVRTLTASEATEAVERNRIAAVVSNEKTTSERVTVQALKQLDVTAVRRIFVDKDRLCGIALVIQVNGRFGTVFWHEGEVDEGTDFIRFSWGHYDQSQEAATADFHRRVKRGY